MDSLFLCNATAPKVGIDRSVQLVTETVQVEYPVFFPLQVFVNDIILLIVSHHHFINFPALCGVGKGKF
jgi:hypothetical protein